MKPYTDDRWEFVGNTLITATAVRLTSDHQSQAGAIWSKIPCNLHNWEMHIHFKVHGSGSELYGDGFAIWYTRDRMTLGPVFGSIDKFVGLAIFFDTYANQNGPHNHGHPYVSAMVNNGSLSYDHDRDGTHTELDGCDAAFRKARHETFAAIRYQDYKLTVSLDLEGNNQWKSCFSVDGIRLPTGFYFGASAATGDLSDNHDIITIKVYDLDEGKTPDDDLREVVPSASVFAAPRDHVDDPKLSRLTGWKYVGVVLLVVLGLCVCSMVAYIIYTKNQEQSRKRFY